MSEAGLRVAAIMQSLTESVSEAATLTGSEGEAPVGIQHAESSKEWPGRSHPSEWGRSTSG